MSDIRYLLIDGMAMVSAPAKIAITGAEQLRMDLLEGGIAWRRSRGGGDLFDAYRNLDLAVESLLSTVVPMRLNAVGRPAAW